MIILLALIIRDAIFLDIDSDDFLDDVGEKGLFGDIVLIILGGAVIGSLLVEQR